MHDKSATYDEHDLRDSIADRLKLPDANGETEFVTLAWEDDYMNELDVIVLNPDQNIDPNSEDDIEAVLHDNSLPRFRVVISRI